MNIRTKRGFLSKKLPNVYSKTVGGDRYSHFFVSSLSFLTPILQKETANAVPKTVARIQSCGEILLDGKIRWTSRHSQAAGNPKHAPTATEEDIRHQTDSRHLFRGTCAEVQPFPVPVDPDMDFSFHVFRGMNKVLQECGQ